MVHCAVSDQLPCSLHALLYCCYCSWSYLNFCGSETALLSNCSREKFKITDGRKGTLRQALESAVVSPA